MNTSATLKRSTLGGKVEDAVDSGLTQLLLQVSNRLAASRNLEEAFQSLEEIVGGRMELAGLRFQPALQTIALSGRKHGWQAGFVRAEAATRAIPVTAGGTHWGTLQVNASLPQETLHFLAQQLALALQRFSLERHNVGLSCQLDLLKEEIELDKLIQRATGILTAAQQMSKLQAMDSLLRQARQRRCSLREHALHVIRQDVAMQATHRRSLAWIA